MKSIVFIFFLLVSEVAFGTNLGVVRDLYGKAAESEKACQQLIKVTSGSTADPVIKGYHGASMMVMAKHVFSPIAKLKYFNKGKQMLEEAIRLAPNNVELRFIRYSIQQHAPFFLGYRSQLAADEKILRQQVGSIEDQQLKSLVLSVLK